MIRIARKARFFSFVFAIVSFAIFAGSWGPFGWPLMPELILKSFAAFIGCIWIFIISHKIAKPHDVGGFEL
jgi:hypothetical protein